MYAIHKGDEVVAHFSHVTVNEKGVLEACNLTAGKARKHIELFLAPGQWDRVVWEDPTGKDDLQISMEWGVLIAESTDDGSTLVIKTDSREGAVQLINRDAQGELVHRQVGPWVIAWQKGDQ